MIGNEKQKTWQKNTIFKCKMLKVLVRLNRLKYFKKVLHIYPLQYKIVKNPILTSSPKRKSRFPRTFLLLRTDREPCRYYSKPRSKIIFNNFRNSGKLRILSITPLDNYRCSLTVPGVPKGPFLMTMARRRRKSKIRIYQTQKNWYSNPIHVTVTINHDYMVNNHADANTATQTRRPKNKLPKEPT